MSLFPRPVWRMITTLTQFSARNVCGWVTLSPRLTFSCPLFNLLQLWSLAETVLQKPKFSLCWRPRNYLSKSLPILRWRPKYAIDRGPSSDQRSTSLGNASVSSSPPHSPHCNSETHSSIFQENPPAAEPFQLLAQVTTQEAQVSTQEGMANFACDPAPFLLFGAHDEQGWHHPARTRLALGGEPPRRHEEYAIASPSTRLLTRRSFTSRLGFYPLFSPRLDWGFWSLVRQFKGRVCLIPACGSPSRSRALNGRKKLGKQSVQSNQ